jgi:RNA polymerase sigma factor (sigma-70 family)
VPDDAVPDDPAPDADADRFTRIYQDDYLRVLGYAVRRTSPELAREAVDEVFLRAWRRMSDLPDPPLPWLLVAARNVISEQRRRGAKADALALEMAGWPDDQSDPSDVVADRDVVLQAVAGMPEVDREALMLTVWDGLGHRAAAKVAGCSVGAFAVRLHRARRRLRTELARLDEVDAPVTRPTAREAS